MNYKDEYDNKLGMVNYMNIFDENSNTIAILGDNREVASQSIGISLANLIGIHGISVAYVEPKFTDVGIIEEYIDSKKKEKLKTMNLVNYYYQWDLSKLIESCEIVILDFSYFTQEYSTYLSKVNKAIHVHNLKLKKDSIYQNLLQTKDKKYSNYYIEERYPKISDGKNSIASMFFGCSKQDLNIMEHLINYFNLKKRISFVESTFYEIIDTLNENINIDKIFKKKLERSNLIHGEYEKKEPYSNSNRLEEYQKGETSATYSKPSQRVDTPVETGDYYDRSIESDYSYNLSSHSDMELDRMDNFHMSRGNATQVPKKKTLFSKLVKKVMNGFSDEDMEDETNSLEEWSPLQEAYEGYNKKAITGKVFGKETIFVTGLKHGSGCSHNSVSIATFISKGYKESVCICHRKGAYNLEDSRISEYTNEFGYDSIFGNNRFIIFDCGNLSELNQEQLVEMNRSNIKIMVCNSDEKYLGQLSSFIQKMGESAKEWVYAFNLVTSKEKELMIKRIMEGYKICFIPVHDKESPERKVTKTWDTLIKRGLL